MGSDNEYMGTESQLSRRSVVGAAAFTIGGYGYIGIGNDGILGYDVDSFYRYDPTTDTWYAEQSFIGGFRDGTYGFNIGQYGYVGSGAPNDNQQYSYSDF